MKVSELPYERVTIEEVKEKLPQLVERIRSAKSVEEVLAAREDYRAFQKRFYTNASLASMRYTINTVDEFYVAENEYYDEIGPEAQALAQEYAKAMLESPFRPELEEKLGTLVFRQWEIELVDVMTHEAGHALNAWFTFDNEPFEVQMGMETAETHSMSMEFFAWPPTPPNWTTSSTAWCTSVTAWRRRWATRTSSSSATTAWAVWPTARKTSRSSAKIS